MEYPTAATIAATADDLGLLAFTWSNYGSPFAGGSHHVELLVHEPRGHRFESSDYLGLYDLPAYRVDPWPDAEAEQEMERHCRQYEQQAVALADELAPQPRPLSCRRPADPQRCRQSAATRASLMKWGAAREELRRR